MHSLGVVKSESNSKMDQTEAEKDIFHIISDRTTIREQYIDGNKQCKGDD